MSVKLKAVGKDGPYIVSDKPVAMIESGRKYGKEAGYQDFNGVTADEVRGMLKNWELMGKPELLIDHGDHGATMAAGFITDVWVEDIGNGEVRLMGLAKWTPKAAEDIANGALPGFSVEIFRDTKHIDSGVALDGYSVQRSALVSFPFYNTMPKVELSCGIIASELGDTYRVALSAKRNGEKKMTKLLTMLGLTEGATEEEAVAKLTGIITERDDSKKSVTSLSAKATEVEVQLSAMKPEAEASKVLRVQLSAVTEDRNALAAKLNEFESQKLSADCAAFIADGQKDGRIATKDEVVKVWREQFSASPEDARKLLATIAPSKTLGKATGLAHSDADADTLGDTSNDAQTVVSLAAEIQRDNPKLTIAEAQGQAFAKLKATK